MARSLNVSTFPTLWILSVTHGQNVSTKDIHHPISVTLTPNPVFDLLNIDVSDDRVTHWIIYDALGQRVGRGQSTSPMQIDFASFPSGVYYLQLLDGDEKLTAGKSFVRA